MLLTAVSFYYPPVLDITSTWFCGRLEDGVRGFVKWSGMPKKRVSLLSKVKGFPLNALINFAALRKTFVSHIEAVQYILEYFRRKRTK